MDHHRSSFTKRHTASTRARLITKAIIAAAILGIGMANQTISKEILIT